MVSGFDPLKSRTAREGAPSDDFCRQAPSATGIAKVKA
jgi:hypothetical protein